MAIIVSANEGGSYTPIEEGTYMALCYGLIDTGDEYSEQYDKCSPKFMILWELVGAGTINIDGREINRSISKSYSKSLNAKSNLRKDLRAWRGREFTEDELKRFDMVNILGAPCQIQIINQTSNGKTYSNIAAIMNLPKGMPRPQPTQGVVNWDFEEHQIGDDAWNAMPPWVRTKIENGETYRYITTGDPGHLTDNRMEEIRETEAYKAYHAKNGDFPVVEDEDEGLPF
jgi:hypothetical protein